MQIECKDNGWIEIRHTNNADKFFLIFNHRHEHLTIVKNGMTSYALNVKHGKIQWLPNVRWEAYLTPELIQCADRVARNLAFA